MVSLLTGLSLIAYIAAVSIYWTDKTLRPPLLLLAGSVATLAQPLWSFLLGAAPRISGSVIIVGSSYILPFWTFLGGGVVLALPALVVFYGLRHHWWGLHYAWAWTFFLAFMLFFLVFTALEGRYDVLLFARPDITNSGLLGALLQAALLAGTSFGLLYSFVTTRHYGLQIAVLPLLGSGLAAAFVLIGVLSSPFWVAHLLHQRAHLSDRIVLGSAIVSLLLVLWAVHLLASGLHAGRRQRLQWR